MSAASEKDIVPSYPEGWPNNRDDARAPTEAEAHALLFEGREFSTQTQTQFFAVWALKAMRQSPACRWVEPREADFVLAEALAESMVHFRPQRYAAINKVDTAAAAYVMGYYAHIPAADYPSQGKPSFDELAKLAFSHARELCGQPAPKKEAAE